MKSHSISYRPEQIDSEKRAKTELIVEYFCNLTVEYLQASSELRSYISECYLDATVSIVHFHGSTIKETLPVSNFLVARAVDFLFDHAPQIVALSSDKQNFTCHTPNHRCFGCFLKAVFDLPVGGTGRPYNMPDFALSKANEIVPMGRFTASQIRSGQSLLFSLLGPYFRAAKGNLATLEVLLERALLLDEESLCENLATLIETYLDHGVQLSSIEQEAYPWRSGSSDHLPDAVGTLAENITKRREIADAVKQRKFRVSSCQDESSWREVAIFTANFFGWASVLGHPFWRSESDKFERLFQSLRPDQDSPFSIMPLSDSEFRMARYSWDSADFGFIESLSRSARTLCWMS